ncbi:ABC transporter ATP-binding protein [Glaciecola petra]|uniref:ABC transporter ATP-binding protein n=1 Tax=Glaciecola petra TaxID=3075602 RepID=A0ABU2ZRN5_9ALTE|nr:ABC transporter ATP-binding protein [Aestuariibacter sp. P117]MDT0594683.1 ABC transporter ATP-binding protein [Aestuariibacter sp. P117]
MSQALIELSDVDLAYDNKCVLEGVSFSLESGEVACILGPSGSGKTSLLRALAGFLQLKKGEIAINGQCVASLHTMVPPQDRSLGLVFQDFALFPHMTVQQNVEFGLFKLTVNEQKQKAQYYMDIMGIAELAAKYPAELSGGQQQRVAIARAIAPEPDVLLMDEAFSSLDPTLREQVTHDVRDIIKRLGLTAILVTHDQSEAFAFADKIAIVAEGRLQQFSNAYSLYHEPQTYFVANFVGEGVFIQGEYNKSEACVETALGKLFTKVVKTQQTMQKRIETSMISSQNGRMDSEAKKSTFDDFTDKQIVNVLLRPDDIIHDDESPHKAIIVERFFRGAFIKYKLQLPSSLETIWCFAPSHHNHHIGETFGISVQLDHLICF